MSRSLALALLEDLDEYALDILAERLAPRLRQAGTAAGRSPWLTVDEAAEYLRCKRQRIYDLRSAGHLAAVYDGARPLYHRDALDAYLSRTTPRPQPTTEDA